MTLSHHRKTVGGQRDRRVGNILHGAVAHPTDTVIADVLINPEGASRSGAVDHRDGSHSTGAF
ncbi:hypothetical protein [Mycolicibacterium canariasense]|uniref:hypothetical protein n=1 Tax=Mycolicibacterium canariasense TaxID=228230 RepID=UPI00104206F4|nr:hypothetical protein [Mycolicibacterium canariasense]MCV7212494.1 hypothetical protein [Mycolicibacterium canariasense]